MLMYRILSAAVGIPVMLFAVWYGGLPLAALVVVIAVAGIIEMSRLWSKMGVIVWLPGALAGAAAYTAAAYFQGDWHLGAAFFLITVISIFYLIATYPNFTLTHLAATVFTSLYAGWMLTHLISLRQLSGGFHYVILVLTATWCTDTFAYFVGINLGKSKLAPVLSPKKSVEGSVGGVAGSVLAALIVGAVYNQTALIHYIIIGLLIGIIGQAGDLAESALKRMAGVKDSGSIIPGHGGVLDRFDSLYVTAPVAFYYLKMVVMK